VVWVEADRRHADFQSGPHTRSCRSGSDGQTASSGRWQTVAAGERPARQRRVAPSWLTPSLATNKYFHTAARKKFLTISAVDSKNGGDP